jgi:hypothetical protein
MSLTSLLAQDKACYNALAAFRNSESLNFLTECFTSISSNDSDKHKEVCARCLSPYFQCLTRILKLVTSEYLKPRRKTADSDDSKEEIRAKRRKIESNFSEKDIGVVVDPTASQTSPIGTMKEGHVDALVEFLTSSKANGMSDKVSSSSDEKFLLFMVVRKVSHNQGSDLYFALNLVHTLIKFIFIYKDVYSKDTLDELVPLSLVFVSETLQSLMDQATTIECASNRQSFLKGCAILRTWLPLQAAGTAIIAQPVINICDKISRRSTPSEVASGLLEMCTEPPFYSKPPCTLIYTSYTTVKLQWLSLALRYLSQCLLDALRKDYDDGKGREVLTAVVTCMTSLICVPKVYDMQKQKEKEKEDLQKNTNGKKEEEKDENRQEKWTEERNKVASYHCGLSGLEHLLHGYMSLMDDDLLEVLNTLLTIKLVGIVWPVCDTNGSKSHLAYNACVQNLMQMIEIPVIFLWFLHWVLHYDENILLDMLLSKETLDDCMSFLVRVLKYFREHKEGLVVQWIERGCAIVQQYKAFVLRLQRERDLIDYSNNSANKDDMNGKNKDGQNGKVAVWVSQETKGEGTIVDPVPSHIWHAQEAELQHIKNFYQHPHDFSDEHEETQQMHTQALQRIYTFLERSITLLKTISKEPSTNNGSASGTGEYVFGPLIELMKDLHDACTRETTSAR